MSVDSRREFFQSGEKHLEWITRMIRTTIDPAFAPQRAVDVGCGVGRILVPLARSCAKAVGVDVASSMLREARKNLADAGVAAELVLGDDELTQLEGTFDFVHSYIVFQHIPPRRGRTMLAALLTKLRPGGVAALHFSYRTPLSPRQRVLRWGRLQTRLVAPLVNLLKGRPASTPYMELYEYDLESVFEMLRGSGCNELHLSFTNHGGLLGVFIIGRRDGASVSAR
jgi:ubiquinone/menaquinone biosynthesis C-methylase UbiE